MGDVSKCLDAIVEFFNNGASQLDSQGNNNEVYKTKPRLKKRMLPLIMPH